jgi:transcription antitermination factor NusG
MYILLYVLYVLYLLYVLYVLKVWRKYDQEMAEKLARRKVGKFEDPELTKVLAEREKELDREKREREKDRESYVVTRSQCFLLNEHYNLSTVEIN